MIHQVRVIFGDTDQMGVVYYANYLRYFEGARAAFLRHVGRSYKDLEAWNVALPVVEAHCRYRKPAHYEDLLDLDNEIVLKRRLVPGADWVQGFYSSRRRLENDFGPMKDALRSNGTLWISWPKGTSSKSTDLTENIVREIGLQHGLVDVKVAAIDAETGVEVTVMGPVHASRADLQKLALAKLRRRLERSDSR